MISTAKHMAIGTLVATGLVFAGASQSAHAAYMVGSFTVGGFSVNFSNSELEFVGSGPHGFVNTTNGQFDNVLVFFDLMNVLDVSSNPHPAIPAWATIYDNTNSPVLVIDIGPGAWTDNAGAFFWQDIPVTFIDPSGTYNDTPGFMSISGQSMENPVNGVYNGSWSASFVGVPEPASIALVGVGGLVLLARRGRKA